MRQAISTKFLGPTNHRGSRVVASCDSGRLVVPWDYALNPAENHRAAAQALFVKLGWNERNDLVGGWTHDHCGVFVMVPKQEGAMVVEVHE